MISAALHLTLAALACLLLGDTSPLTVAAALLLGLSPDLDTPKSLVGRLLRPLSVALERRVGHRTATHSALAVGLIAGVAYLLAPAHWPALTAAYAAHLLLDLLIGAQGIMLFWPAGEWLTLTAWRDDGPAPRVLLLALLPALLLVVTWGQLAPLLSPAVLVAAQVANPIATPHPSPSPRPSVQLHFALPSGVGLSALRVRRGDTIAEGQTLASWGRPACTGAPMCAPPPTPTRPALLPTPWTLPHDCSAPACAPASPARVVAEAQAALGALITAQAAERAALVAAQQRATADQQRVLADQQRALDALQPRHEREQQEHQHAVDGAHQALLDAQAAQKLPTEPDAAVAQAQRAAERVHTAEARLREALDAQNHMRTAQGIQRAEAEAAVAQAQADRDALPVQQRQALAKLDADHSAGKILATSRVASARGQAADTQRATEREATLVAATATVAAVAWQSQVTTTAQAHQAAATATALAWPTPAPAPSQVISHAAGVVVGVSAEEHDGQFTVTIELIPEV